MKFADYELKAELLAAIQETGFTECTPIQDAVMAAILKGKDVSGLAQTGTGKTAAFVVPLIDRIIRFKAGETGERVPLHWRKNFFVLVLVPTRELAAQVEAAIAQFGKNCGMKSISVFGGASYDDQKRGLREGVEFVVGTPGRLLDLYKSHDLDLNSVGAIVFDEADRMFDMGFKDDMKFILRRVPRHRQFLLFSATLNFEVLNTAYQFGAEPMEFNVSRDQVTAEGIDHEILHVGQFDKPMYLLSVLKRFAPEQCIVFSNFKHNVGGIARFLKNNGIEAIPMSSLLSQTQRNKVLESFRTGKKQILVATDVAARGLDIKGVDLVVNYDLPDEAQGYVHRIGRTGRAGLAGKAVGLVSDRDVEALMRIEEYLKEKIKTGWLEETDLLREYKPFVAESEGARRPRPQVGGGGRNEGRFRGRGAAATSPSRSPRGPQNPVSQQRSSSSQPQTQPQTQTSSPLPSQPSPQRPAPSRPPQGETPVRGHTQGRRPTQDNRSPQTPPPLPAQDTQQENGKVKEKTHPDAHGQTADSSHSATANQHRDRRLGRHGGVFGPQTPQQGPKTNDPKGRNRKHPDRNQSQSQSQAHQPNSTRNRDPQPQKETSNVMPPRRQLKKTNRIFSENDAKANAKETIGKKMKSFLSRLFK